MNKSTEQQIGEAAAFLSATLQPKARNRHEFEQIAHRIDFLEHKLKAMSALFYDNDPQKALFHESLSQLSLKQINNQ